MGGDPKPVANYRVEDLLTADAERKPARKSVGGMVKLRRGITMDTGAHHNVIPRRLVGKKKIRPSPGSRIGMSYVGAGGEKIRNEGEVDFPSLFGKQ